MTKLDILDVHKNCLDFLLSYQATHEKFYFVPRRKNNQHKLEQGMYFVGGKNYVDLSFWIGEDSKGKIHNIAFVITDNGYFILPKPDYSNVGWLGGLIDNSFRISDDINRMLVFITILLLPGRLIATTVVSWIEFLKK